MRGRVEALTADRLVWPFHGAGEPVFLVPAGGYGTSRVPIDPFPAYPHDVDVAAEVLDLCEQAAPIEPTPSVFVLDREPPARTNGWAERGHAWDEDTEKWVPGPGLIVLAGKRVPPHPAVTRYLVAHEYGHHVDYAICRSRGLEPNKGEDFDEEYAELRGCADRVADPSAYGGGTWHATTGELIANDFRILVAGVEPDFWPHPGFEHPYLLAPLAEWWATALDKATVAA